MLQKLLDEPYWSNIETRLDVLQRERGDLILPVDGNRNISVETLIYTLYGDKYSHAGLTVTLSKEEFITFIQEKSGEIKKSLINLIETHLATATKVKTPDSQKSATLLLSTLQWVQDLDKIFQIFQKVCRYRFSREQRVNESISELVKRCLQ